MIRDAHERGYKTVLSLKFPKNTTSFPQPGSPEMTAELERLDRVLPLVLGTVDIVTIGNEPFIESLPAERDQRLNEFYETIARHVIEVRNKIGQKTHFLRDEVERFRATGRLAVATYGFRQIPSMTANWSAAKVPWLLNSVFAAMTVQPRDAGMSTPGYAWIDDFRALQ